MTHLLVGSYGDAGETVLRTFHVDVANLLLEPADAWNGAANLSWVLTGRGTSYIYAVSETADGAVHTFRCDHEGRLTPISSLGLEANGPCHLAVDDSLRWMTASSYAGGSLLVVRLDDGVPVEVTDRLRRSGSSMDPRRQQRSHVHASAFVPGTTTVVATDLGTDDLIVVDVSANGSATVRQAVGARPGSGPRHIVWAPNGETAYVIHELDSTLSTYRYEHAQRRLAEVDVVSARAPLTTAAAQRNGAAALRLHRDGTQLVVTNRGDDSICVFDVRDGHLRLVGGVESGGVWPRDALPVGDACVAVANQSSGDVRLVDLRSGRTGGSCEVPGAAGLAAL